MKNMIAARNQKRKSKRNRWRVDTNSSVFIFPMHEEAEVQEMMRQIRADEDSTTCMHLCELPKNLLPQPLFVHGKDGTVSKLPICKKCVLEFLNNLD